MSSISLAFEKQVRNLYIVDAAATETTMKAFVETASPGEVKIFHETGKAPVAKEPFYICVIERDGKYQKSDIIDPTRIKYMATKAPVTKVGKKIVHTIGAVTAGKVYNLNLKIHAGNSETNFATIFASVKAVTGDTVTTVAGKLAVELAKNLASDMKTATNKPGTSTINSVVVKNNKYFTVTVAAGVITIQEKDWILDGYVPGVKAFDQLMWNTTCGGNFYSADEQVTTVVTPPVYGVNQGYDIMEMERALNFHRKGHFQSNDITNTINAELLAKTNETYHTLDITFWDDSIYDPQHADKMVTIASPTQSLVTNLKAAIDALITPVAAPAG